MSNFDILKNILDAQQDTSTKAYDTTATVRRIEGSTAWVHIPGGVDETPVKLTVSAQAGDTVQVRVGGGTAWMVGNATAPPTDDRVANIANNTAKEAYGIAESAVKDAETAHKAAESAVASAEQAELAANSAQASADNANEYASRALGNLSTVQSVAETLNWITEHGTMTLTSDTQLDPSHVYFVADQNGDYVVGGQHYSVVSEPDVADISTYYELSIDESLNNYVATHLSLTNDGLIVTNDDTKWYVLIKNDGIDIVDNTNGTNKVVASYRQNIELNSDSGNRAFLSADGFSIQESHGVGVFRIIAQNEPNGTIITDTLTGNGTQASFWFFGADIAEIVEITIDDIVQSADTYSYDTFEQVLTFNSAPADGSKIKVQYKDIKGAFGIGFGSRLYWHGSANIGKYSATFGESLQASGADSFAQGYKARAIGTASSALGVNCEADGHASHAEGYYTHSYRTAGHAEGYGSETGYENQNKGSAAHAEGYYSKAGGDYSHAEGNYTTAYGESSHAEGVDTFVGSSATGAHVQNVGTYAISPAQTIIGKYNNNYASVLSSLAFVLGNGTDDNNRSNALTVDWDGNVQAAGQVKSTTETYSLTLPSAVGFGGGLVRNGGVAMLSIINISKLPAGNTTLCTLPEGWRPPISVMRKFEAPDSSAGPVRLFINSSGVVSLYNYGAAITAASNISDTITYVLA